VSDQWTRKTDIPGPARQSAVAFTINGKGYVGLGSDLYDDGLADLWEWDPAGDSWFQKTGLTGEERSGASAFVLNSKAYICSGFNNGFVLNDMWEFDAQGNSWTSKGSLNSGAAFAVAFSAAGKGYMSCGLAANYVSTSRLFEYQGATVSAHSVPLSASGCQVYGNGFGAAAIKLPEGTEKVSLHIIDIFGKEIKRTSILHPGEPNVIDCSELKSGAFIYQVKNKEQLICSGYLITVR
jgi:hypothetical protein